MTSADRKLSHTIRIDLIPDLPPDGALGDKKKRIRVASGTGNGAVTHLSSPTDGDSHYQQLFQSHL